MNQEAIELHSRYVSLRAKDSELRVKLEQMRDILAKADERRARERNNPARWNPIIDNLEQSYKQLKQEVERTRHTLTQTERELNRALDATGDTMASVDPGHTMLTPLDVDEPEFTPPPLTEAELSGYTNGTDQLVGWRDVLHMSIDNLSTLSEDEIFQVRSYMASARAGSITDTDRRLVEGRLQLAAQLRASALEEDAAAPGVVDRRRQIVLRAAIDKIQHNRAQQMTEEEVRAVLLCRQRLSLIPTPSMPEKRLLRIIEASLNVLRRHKAKTN